MKKSFINLKGKSLLWLPLVTLLLVSIASKTTIAPAYAQVSPKVFVDPKDNIFYTDEMGINDTFTVDVKVANVTGLGGVEFELWWDPTLLSCVSMVEVLFTQNTPPGEEGNIWKIKHVVDPDRVWYAYGYMDMARAIDGGYAPINISETYPPMERTVASITLKVERQPTKAEVYLECDLELRVSKLAGVEPYAPLIIPHTKEDGYYKLNWAQPEFKPYLSVQPSMYISTYLNEEFDINVVINNLDEDWEMVGLQFKLGYNTSILEVSQVTNGTFFEPFGDPPNGGVFYFKFVEYDYVLVGVMVLPDENGTWHAPFPSGSGVVASIRFKAIYGNFSEVIFCDLDLYDIKGGDTNANPIPFDPEEDGYYRSAIGDDIPPSIGTPSQVPGVDEVLPDQEVKVSVSVTDADSGVKNVTLSYTTNDGISWNDVTMIYNSTTSLYEGMIPGKPADTIVKYRIIAYDRSNNSAVEDNAGLYYAYTVIPEFKTWLSLFITIFIITTAIILIKRKWKPHRLSNAKQNM